MIDSYASKKYAISGVPKGVRKKKFWSYDELKKTTASISSPEFIKKLAEKRDIKAEAKKRLKQEKAVRLLANRGENVEEKTDEIL